MDPKSEAYFAKLMAGKSKVCYSVLEFCNSIQNIITTTILYICFRNVTEDNVDMNI